MKNKKLLIITSLIILLPCLVGLALWDHLPDQMPTHFGASGMPDGWSSKGFAVFGLPLIMLFFQFVIHFATKLDKQNQTGGNRKVLDMILYLFPVVSVLMNGLVYAVALQQSENASALTTKLLPVLMGLLFIFVGNYLPKCRQNSTLGIKLKWTFHNEENWNKTHRVAGITWVICGSAMILLGILGFAEGILLLMIPMLAVPVIYSWVLYRKQIASGAVQPGDPKIVLSPAMTRVSWGILAVVVLMVVLLFTGAIEK